MKIGYNDWNITASGGTDWVVYKKEQYQVFKYVLPKKTVAEHDKLLKKAIEIAKEIERRDKK